ncbi:MAG: peptide chain release factor N(5)-glutamine methyltransferase [Planctomycetota bacterium]|jgi:release factor glutamine methyltransferase|nr:peptide chain release factor N(5)-glutamine methyltransferase [Planctomycetota bacterium]
MTSGADKTWKPLALVKVTADYLAGRNVPSPRLDAELLLCRAMKIARRVELYAGFERTVTPAELAVYREMVRRRAGREPVSRILGEREFMGIRFLVTPDVLSPRPETELLVEAALAHVAPVKMPAGEEPAAIAPGEVDAALERMLDAYAEDADADDEAAPATAPLPVGSGRMEFRGSGATVRPGGHPPKNRPRPAVTVRALDLGTGSGCIAVAVAAVLPGARITAVDKSQKALAVARKNAEAAGMAERIDFREGDWFSACPEHERYDLILANPPYLVKDDPEIWPEVADYDPPPALYGGADGLDHYRKIAPGLGRRLNPGGAAFLEVGVRQADAVRNLLLENGLANIRIHKDYGGVGRVVSGEREA